MNLDRFDDFPAPRMSPRLSADVESILHARPVSSVLRHKPTDGQRKRIAREIAIFMAIEGGMSQRVAAKAFGLSQPGILKAYRRMACRKSRA